MGDPGQSPPPVSAPASAREPDPEPKAVVVVPDLDDTRFKVAEVKQRAPSRIPDLDNPRRYGMRSVPHLEASWRIFLTVAIIAGAIGLMLGLFAWFTYPSIGDITALTGSQTDADRLKAWNDARQAWSQQFVTIAQAVLFGSIVPLLATIAGYALAQRQSKTDE